MDLDVILQTSSDTPTSSPRKVEIGKESWDDSAPSKTLINSEEQLFIAEWSSTYVNVMSTLYELHIRKTQKKNKIIWQLGQN